MGLQEVVTKQEEIAGNILGSIESHVAVAPDGLPIPSKALFDERLNPRAHAETPKMSGGLLRTACKRLTAMLE